jgi:nitroreductase
VELLDALRSTGAVREFTSDPVDDAVLARVLDTARFAPSGGNQQGWHVVVVKDPEKRRAVRDLYLNGWYDYIAMNLAGVRPWAPTNDRAAEAAALENASAVRANATPGFAEHLDSVPVLLAVFVDLSVLAAVDRDSNRYSFAGGASVYPFAWNLLLAGREEGLGGVITTMCIREEAAMKRLLDAPDRAALAAVIALGHPAREIRKLRRATVNQFAAIDSYGGPPLQG